MIHPRVFDLRWRFRTLSMLGPPNRLDLHPTNPQHRPQHPTHHRSSQSNVQAQHRHHHAQYIGHHPYNQSALRPLNRTHHYQATMQVPSDPSFLKHLCCYPEDHRFVSHDQNLCARNQDNHHSLFNRSTLRSCRLDRYNEDMSAPTLHPSASHAPSRYSPYATPHQHDHMNPSNQPASSLNAKKLSKQVQTDQSFCRAQPDYYRPVYSDDVQPRGQWGPLRVTSRQISSGQWGPLASVAMISTKRDNPLTERQKRNLNLNPEKPFIIQPANYSSHRVVATNNTGSQTLFFFFLSSILLIQPIHLSKQLSKSSAK
ncbi:hypothetical protein PGT21_003602 [Puccinia graminis f. sp. tritici]|uniref:Uncharacterized protein n=1 Tax=Puccinia graminis f. sp. tritici TaxID=56615 RepID=A0A5B0LV73_PUCGR|nr:hypothetical protein PGT21_003602 [Puccinia graminis f. sp. tritici]